METRKVTAGLFIFTAMVVINSSSCEKKTELPVVVTSEITDITQFNAISGGTVTDDGGADVTDSGICWSTDEEPTVEDNKISCCAGKGSYIIRIKPLNAGTKYYVRAYATNSEGTAYGDQLTLVTEGKSVPGIITNMVSGIDLATALSGGIIYESGGTQITSLGVCWSKNPSPTINDNKTSDKFLTWSPTGFYSNLTGLEKGTKYYVRAYAITELGPFYGNEVDFTTRNFAAPAFNPDMTYGTLTDIDGNIYKTVDIGTQTWMAENLRTTRLNDGTEIRLYSNWTSGSVPAMCWYKDDPDTYKTIYGAYYNYFTVKSNKICPVGWHVPGLSDWTQLFTFLGSEGQAGGRLKENGTSNWINPNYGASNESGFTGLPAGFRNDKYYDAGSRAYFWSSTITIVPNYPFSSYSYYNFYYLTYKDRSIGSSNTTGAGVGVNIRCVKD